MVWQSVDPGSPDGPEKLIEGHGLTNLTNLMGYYALLAFNANTFTIDLPAERTEPVLPI